MNIGGKTLSVVVIIAVAVGAYFYLHHIKITASLSLSNSRASGQTLLQPSDFAYLGYYDTYIADASSAAMQGFTHRYVNGDLRFLTTLGDLREFSIAGKNYGDVITTTTNRYEPVGSDQNWSGRNGEHFGIWWNDSLQQLWSAFAYDYNGQYQPVWIATGTLNNNQNIPDTYGALTGTVNSVKQRIGLSGIHAKKVFGGCDNVPTWFQSQYSTGPYTCGWGGYTSIVAVGASLGLTMFTLPDPNNYSNDAQIPTSQFKTIADHSAAMNAGGDWYAQGSPTSFDMGQRLTWPATYFGQPATDPHLGCGDYRGNGNTGLPPPNPPCTEAQGGTWQPPAPDGKGRWTWGDNYTGTGNWIDSSAKSGLITIASLGSGKTWYCNSSLCYEKRQYELHIFDPVTLGKAALGQIQPWQVQPASMTLLNLPGLGIDGWTGSTLSSGAGKNVEGATYDPVTQKLFLLGCGVLVPAPYNHPGCRIYVYGVNTGSGPSTVPSPTPSPSPTPASVGFVQEVHNKDFSNGTGEASGVNHMTFDCPAITPKAGNMLAVIWTHFGGPAIPVTITDTAGNSWNNNGIPAQTSAVGGHGGVIGGTFALNVSGNLSNDIVTLHFSAPKDYVQCKVLEYAGVITSNALDTTAVGYSEMIQGITSGSFSTHNTNELVLVAAVDHALQATWSSINIGSSAGLNRIQDGGTLVMDRGFSNIVSNITASATADTTQECCSNGMIVATFKLTAPASNLPSTSTPPGSTVSPSPTLTPPTPTPTSSPSNNSSQVHSFITSISGDGAFARNNYTGNVGFRFKVGSSNIIISKLGRWKMSGNSRTHQVSILDSNGTSVVSASVDMNGGSAGSFVYATIPDTVLTAGSTYYCVSSEVSGNDTWNDQYAGLSTTTDASVLGAVYNSTTQGIVGSYSYVPPNFMIGSSGTGSVVLQGDLNHDGIVNSLDWSLMNSKWFTADATADLNHDGIVNSLDFSLLNKNWLKTN